VIFTVYIVCMHMDQTRECQHLSYGLQAPELWKFGTASVLWKFCIIFPPLGSVLGMQVGRMLVIIVAPVKATCLCNQLAITMHRVVLKFSRVLYSVETAVYEPWIMFALAPCVEHVQHSLVEIKCFSVYIFARGNIPIVKILLSNKNEARLSGKMHKCLICILQKMLHGRVMLQDSLDDKSVSDITSLWQPHFCQGSW